MTAVALVCMEVVDVSVVAVVVDHMHIWVGWGYCVGGFWWLALIVGTVDAVEFFCRMWTRPPFLHDKACLTVILAPHLSQCCGMSSGTWLYPNRTLSRHLFLDMMVLLRRLG